MPHTVTIAYDIRRRPQARQARGVRPPRASGLRDEAPARRPDDGMLRFCGQAMRKACGDLEAGLREFNGETGHVHLLVSCPPKVSVSALVNNLKGVSARKLRSQYQRKANRAQVNGHFWSPSYLAASCGGTPLRIIRQHLDQQRPA